jgi:nitrous oxide reductase accessory protein NosL
MGVALASAAVILSAAVMAGAKGGPLPAQTSLNADGQMALSDSDRCPVCAMHPARRPETAAAMTLTSGETFYFCGNGCLLRTWLRPMVYLGKSQDQIDRIVVHDYFSGKAVDGRKATWVAGSDVVGPMGPAIIALEDASLLDSFIKRHGGKTVFTFNEVNDALWKRISKRELPSAKTE